MTDGPHVEIARAESEDVEAVAALAGDSLLEAWSEESFAASLDAPGAVFLVARRPGAGLLVGFLLGQRVIDELHVLSLAVGSSTRRQGVARALLEAALGDPPLPHVLLEVRPSNVAARGFYRTLGFEEVGLRSAYYPDGEDALLLTRGAPTCAPAAARSAP